MKFGSFARRAYSLFRKFVLIKGKAGSLYAMKEYGGDAVVAVLGVKENCAHVQQFASEEWDHMALKRQISRSFIQQSVLRQVQSLFQSELST
jgi:hypothetical protein